MKVAAAVVTFNRKEELAKNIRAILNQTLVVDRYYIIDNHGADQTEAFLREEGLLNHSVISYVYLPENIGGAGGFFTGLKMAYDDGYDYICLMDDDGRPDDENMMSNLVGKAEALHEKKQEILLNSLVYGPDGNTLSFGLRGGIKTKEDALKRENDNLIEGTINPFNGTLVSRELVAKIGFPDKEFFIKGDEQDYFYRAINVGAFVATVVNSNYYHPVLERIPGKIFGKEFIASTEAPWKEYYRARNYTYIFKRRGEPKKYIRQNLRQIIWALKYNPQKWKTVRMIGKGWCDGMAGRLGPRVKP